MDIKTIETFLLDMDGTVYLGDRLLEGAKNFFETLCRQHKQFFFLTNNSSIDVNSYTRKLKRLGLSNITVEQIITSGQCTAWYLKQFLNYTRIFLLGTRELELEFLRFGFTLVQQKPQAVVLGYDKTLTWSKLERACTMIRQGCPFFATHPDLNCPTAQGPVIDTGSIIHAIEASTSQFPRIFGKPSKEMIEYALERSGADRLNTCVVGDRLYTDIAMGNQGGLCSILVLSGETQLSDLASAPWKPTWVFPSLLEINQALIGCL